MVNILVVDDEKEQNQIICKFLMKNNYQVTGCLDASKAYDAMFENHFDIILSDIMMPGIDGFEFAESIRAIDKNIPILFISAKDDIKSKARGYSLDIDDYMVKPIELDELLMKIKALLRRAQIKDNN